MLRVFSSENDDAPPTGGLRLRPTRPCGASKIQFERKRERRYVRDPPGCTDVAPCGTCPCSVTALILTPSRNVSAQQFVNVTATVSTPERSRILGNVK